MNEWPVNGPTKLDVPMFALFDQKIDPAAVLASVKVTSNGESFPVELLDDAAIAKDKTLASIVKAAHEAEQDGRWLAFRATKPLKRSSGQNWILPSIHSSRSARPSKMLMNRSRLSENKA